MRNIWLLILIVLTPLHALDLKVSVAQKDSQRYCVVEIQQKEPFLCSFEDKIRTKILCSFDKIPILRPRKTQNDFFILQTFMKDKRFHLRIKAKKNVILIPQKSTTLSSKPIQRQREKSIKWIAVGFSKTPPYIKKQPQGINFALSIKKNFLPFVSTLNIDAQPIPSSHKHDLEQYKSLLALFKQKEYKTLVSRINTKLKQKDLNKLFMPEILSLKIQSLVKIGNQDREIVTTAEPWVDSYTTHKDIAQIMLILAKSYMVIGITKKGMDLFNVLIREYPNNKYSDLAKIYKGNKLAKEGKVYRAKDLYSDVYYSTKDVDVASLAAFELAQFYLSKQDVKTASKFLDKIVASNDTFFHKDIQESFKLAEELSQRGAKKSAARLVKSLQKIANTNDKLYPKLLLFAARNFKDAKDYNESIHFYDKYIKTYSYLKTTPQIEKEKEFLLFDIDYGSDAQRLKLYDEIIKKYPRENIAKEATYKKMLLFYKQNNFSGMSKNLKDFESLSKNMFPNLNDNVKNITRKLAKEYIAINNCPKAIEILQKYKILLPPQLNEKIYICASKTGAYNMALDIARSQIEKLSKKDSLIWQKRELNMLLAQNNCKDYLIKAREFANTNEILSLPQDKQIHVQAAFCLQKLSKDERFIAHVKHIEKHFKNAQELLDLYKRLISIALDKKKYRLAKEYTIKLINAQRLKNITSFSPFVELSFLKEAKALKEDLDLALSLLEQIEQKNARVFFELYRVYADINDTNRSNLALTNCKKSPPSAFQKLCLDINATSPQ